MIERRTLLLHALGFGAALMTKPAFGDTRRLVVMTSYPQEVISRYLDAFAKAYPDTRIDIVWHSGDDARDYLLGEGRGKIDVYWSPAFRTFIDLAGKGVFQKLNVDRSALPGRIGKQAISDPNGYYEASEFAGYGFIVNPDYLLKAGIPEPKEWADLANPIYAGHINMPVPSHIGFAPTITEIILQSAGWQAGWAQIAQIAANAKLQVNRGDEVLGEVARGESGIALTIDFFAAQAIARGAKLRFVYPTANAFDPATIAIPVDAVNQSGANDFVNFVLSDAGQKLLIDPDLRRLSIRPSVYSTAPAGYYNPWAASTDGLTFDPLVFSQRRDLDNALFDRMIYEPRDRVAPMWANIHRIEAHASSSSEVKSLISTARTNLTAVPLSESDIPTLATAFTGRRRNNGESTTLSRAAEAHWTETVNQNIERAQAALTVANTLVSRL